MGHHSRIHEDTRTDVAAHHDHRNVEQAQLACKWQEAQCTSPARSSSAISSFFIPNMASTAFAELSRLDKSAGTICQLSPNLSFSQPHRLSLPPAESLAHYSSISSCESQRTTNETASENRYCGPPLRAVKIWPSNSKATVSAGFCVLTPNRREFLKTVR